MADFVVEVFICKYRLFEVDTPVTDFITRTTFARERERGGGTHWLAKLWQKVCNYIVDL